MKIFVLLLVTLGVSLGMKTFTQDNEKSSVKNDFFFDSPQTIAARKGHFLLWPASESSDMNGKDANVKPNFNSLAIQSRLKGAIAGPDAFDAKT